jgi:hypothetical protein
MKTLTITWQRLLMDEDGRTCVRCGSTEKELERAVETLKQSLAPLGIEVVRGSPWRNGLGPTWAGACAAMSAAMRNAGPSRCGRSATRRFPPTWW